MTFSLLWFHAFKDLQELREGDVVSGTAEIEQDLGFDLKPRVKGYFTIQYKF